jgi:hypothetical protein
MSLIIIGKEYADKVRADISAGNIAPQIGTELRYTDATDPNTKYPGTTWVKVNTSSVTVGDVSLVTNDWMRFA